MEARLQDNNALNNVVEDHLAELPFRQWLKREQRAKAQLTAGRSTDWREKHAWVEVAIIIASSLRSRQTVE